MRSETIKSRKFLLISGLLILALALSLVLVKANPSETEAASSASYDLTTDNVNAEDGALINGAWWFPALPTDPESLEFVSFLDYGAKGTEAGYNTDGTLEFNTNNTGTDSVALGDMVPLEYDGHMYYEFKTDLNEKASDPYISIDDFEIWMTDDPNETGYPFDPPAVKVYDLDGDGDTWIMADYSWGEGSSGHGEDLKVLVPADSLDNVGLDYVVLYVHNGSGSGGGHNWNSTAGPEQWGYEIYPGAPLPGVPNTVVTITSDEMGPVDPGDTVTLTVTETNTGTESVEGDVDLDNVEVLVDDGGGTIAGGTLNEANADSQTGGTADDGVLEPGEEWSWDIAGVVVTATTTFTATGYGELVSDDTPVTYPTYGTEQDSVTVTVNVPVPENPSTEVTIEADPEFVIDDSGEEVFEGGSVTLTIIEVNDGDVDLYDVQVVLFDGSDYTTLNASAAVESMTDDDILEVGETMTWTEEVDDIVVDTTFTANGHGWVDGTQGDPDADICCDEGYCAERDSVTVPVVAPYTDVGISVPAEIVYSTGPSVFSGDEVTLTITEQNTGDQDLEDVKVTVTNDVTGDEWELEADSPATVEFDGEDYAVTFSGDNGETGVLDVGETWTWTITGVVITETTVFTAMGEGYLEDETEISFDTGFLGEMDELEIFVCEPETCLTLNASGYEYMETVGGIDTYYVFRGGKLILEITEENLGNCDISKAHVVLDDGTTFWTLNDLTADNPLTPVDEGVVQSKVDSGLFSNTILDYDETVTHDGEKWSWDVPMMIGEDTTFTANGYGVVLHENIDTANGYENETDMINVVVMDRGTYLQICMETDVDSCGCTCGEAWVLNADKQNKGTLVITEKNWGDVDLTDVEVCVTNDVTAQEWTLTDETTEVAFGFTCTGCMDPCLEPEPDCEPNIYAVTFSGDDGDGVLEPHEIWKWVIEDVEFMVDTVFTADGSAYDELGDTWVEYPEFVCERDSVCIYIAGIHPSTLVHMCTVEDILYSDGGRYVYPGETVALTVTEENNGDVALTDAYVEFKTVTGAGTEVQILDASTATESMTDDDILEVGEVWTWTVEAVIEIDTTLVADGHGFVLCHDISYENGFMCERDKLLIEVVEPDTLLTIEADPEVLEHAGTVTLTITEMNTGDCDVSNAYVVVDHGVGVLTPASAGFSSTGNMDGILDIGETWTWEVEVEVGDATTFTASGYGVVLGEQVSYENGYLGERDSVSILSVNPETQVNIDADDTTIPAGSAMDLRISEENIGNADLFGVFVELECIDEVTLDEETTTVTVDGEVYVVVFSGDDGDGILNVGETWLWTIVDVVFDTDTCVVANGHGWVDGEDIGNEETDVSKENGYLCEEDTFCINVTLA